MVLSFASKICFNFGGNVCRASGTVSTREVGPLCISFLLAITTLGSRYSKCSEWLVEASGSEDLWKGEGRGSPLFCQPHKEGNSDTQSPLSAGFPLRKDGWFWVDVGPLCSIVSWGSGVSLRIPCGSDFSPGLSENGIVF